MTILLALMSLQPMAAPDAQLPRPARSEASLATYVSDSDYPADALARGVGGTVEFRLVVDPEGRVIDCKIEQSSGTASLDAQTCAIMTARARFLPARDRSGHAVMDTVRSRIRWVIGTPLPPGINFFAPERVAIILDVSQTDEIRCSMEVNGIPLRAVASCPAMLAPFIQATRGRASPNQFVVVQSFMPEGGIITAPAIPYGQLLSEAEAEVIVSASGEVSQCRTISRTIHVPGSPAPPDLCGTRPLPRYSAGASDRRARVTVSLFAGSRTSS